MVNYNLAGGSLVGVFFTFITWAFAVYFFFLTYRAFTKNDSGSMKYVYLLITVLYTIYAVLITRDLWGIYSRRRKFKGLAEDLIDDEVPEGGTDGEAPVEQPVIEGRLPKIRDFGDTPVIPRTEDDTLSFDQFLEIYKTDKFIDQYSGSLLIMLKKKIKEYSQELKTLNRTIDTLSGAGQTDKTDHGPLERARQTRDQLKNILKELRQRIIGFNRETVIRDLDLAVRHPKHGILSLMGRQNIKDFLALQIFTFARNLKIFSCNFQNIAVYGDSGLGKTKIGDTVAYVYSKTGILACQKMNIVTKTDLTNMYINGSSDITRKHINNSLEGVLFIDEAYELAPDHHNNNSEVITELVKAMDVHKGKFVVIVAGYEFDMRTKFMTANEGLPRRFPHQLSLDKYTPGELTNILISFIENSCEDLEIVDHEAQYLYGRMKELSKVPKLLDKQAGDMFNLSGEIVRSIYGHLDITWSQTDLDNNIRLLSRGFNGFLRAKGKGKVCEEPTILSPDAPRPSVTGI